MPSGLLPLLVFVFAFVFTFVFTFFAFVLGFIPSICILGFPDG
jgi:hypothetical protein